MRIIKTTDGQHIGVNIEAIPSRGQSVMLGDFEFVAQNIVITGDGSVLLSNPNYQIELQE